VYRTSQIVNLLSVKRYSFF